MDNKTNQNPIGPPKLAVRFFKTYCRSILHEELLGDLLEKFHHDLKTSTRYSANMNYWLNVLRLMNKYTLKRNNSERSHYNIFSAMIKIHLTLAMRRIVRHRLFSFINIFGFSLGLATCMVIFLFVRHELNFDSFHKNSDHIYRMTNQVVRSSQTIHWATTPPALASALKASFPQVAGSTRLRYADNHYFSVGDNNFYERSLFYADSSFLDIFDFELLAGNRSTALDEPNSVLITEDLAFKYFGERLPLGKTMTMDENKTLKVTGILAPLPANSHIQFDILVSFATYEVPRGYLEGLDSWAWMGFTTYVLLDGNQNIASLENGVRELYLQHEKRLVNLDLRAYLQPLKSIHLSSSGLINTDGVSFRFGNKTTIYGLSIVALLVLSIAGFNFTTISTAMALDRAQEVSIRKILGANRRGLFTQLLLESILLAFISSLLATSLILLIAEPVNSLFSVRFIPSVATILESYHYILGVSFFLGALAGLYPSAILSGQRQRGDLKKAGGSTFARKYLSEGIIVVQFIISIGLISGSLVGTKQINFVRNKSLGFDKEQILVVKIPREEMQNNYTYIRNELLQNPYVVNFSATSHLPDGSIGSSPLRLGSDPETNSLQTHYFQVDYDFLETMGIALIDGRFFSKEFPGDSTQALVLNQSAIKALNLEDPIGTKVIFPSNTERTIVGVIEDFHFTSLHNGIEPMALVMPFTNPRNIFLRTTSADFSTALNAISDDWNRILPNAPFDYFFLEDHLDQMYEQEQNLSKLISGFTVLAVVLACLGLYGLVAFSLKTKVMEIGIRKVLGASLSSILLLLSKRFWMFVIIAMIIAYPLIWHLADLWLNNFAYRVSLQWWTFGLSGILLILVTSATISIQTIQAALQNPVKALRNE